MKSISLTTLAVFIAFPVFAADFADSQPAKKAAAPTETATEKPAAAPAATIKAAPASTAAAAPAADAAEQTGSVARAVFTSAVNNREPTDNLTSLTNDTTSIMFFTELQGLQGQTVTHRWERGEDVMSEVKFEVGSARWRVYSSKRLDPSWTGEWKVSVLDANGSTLSASTFTYATAAEAPAAEPASAPAQ